MRFSILLVFFLSFQALVFSQAEEPIKPSKKDHYYDLTFGAGSSYGGFGTKSVIGYNGTGLLLGLGSMEGHFAKTIGLQLCFKGIYLNLARGAYGAYTVEWPGTRKEGLIEGTIFMVGIRIKPMHDNGFILDFSGGTAFGGKVPSPFGNIEEESQGTFGIGLGWTF